MHETLLTEADRHISDCMRRIDQQRRRVLALERRGDDTTSSTRLLAALIHFLAIAELRRETLLRLAAAELKPMRQAAGAAERWRRVPSGLVASADEVID